MDTTALAELRYGVGSVALVPFAMPGTDAAADVFSSFWAMHDVFLMSHHGALTVGRTLTEAHQRMESLEHGARIMWAARALGPVKPLPDDALATLDALRQAARTT